MRNVHRWVYTVLTAGWLTSAVAHETWLTVSSYRPKPEEKVTVRIGNGHAFPKSENRIASDWIHRLCVLRDGVAPEELTPQPLEGEYTAETGPAGSGVLLFVLELQRPRMPEPVGWIRALAVGGDRDQPERYRTGEGLEIVPESPLTRGAVGESVPFAVYWKGVRIESRITFILPGSGREVILSTTPDRPAVLVVKEEGIYLAAVSHQGRTATLTFFVGGETR